MRRHELSDEEWALVEPVLPVQRNGGRGRPPKTNREMLNGMMWILRTGAPWRDLPERFGPWQSVYHYFNQWRKTGVFDRVLEALQIRLDEKGYIDWDLWCVDGSSIRASRAAAGASKKVGGGTLASRKTTPWAARAADSGASSTWLLTARAFPWPSKLARGKRTNRHGSSR
jgi:transposase